MVNGDNKIIVALDNEIVDGLRLISLISGDKELRDMVYGLKVGSLWVLKNGIDIVVDVHSVMWEGGNLILDMQKWSTDIPEIVAKQVNKVAETGAVEELIACPMGGGVKSLTSFANTCKDGGIRPLCVLEMTHPGSGSYLKDVAYYDILSDAVSLGIDGFVIPATKEPKVKIKEHLADAFPDLTYDLYATGFKVQGGQAEPMRKFGVSKYIIGRAIYESEDEGQAIRDAYAEINQK